MVNATNTGIAMLRKSQADLQARLGTVVSAQGICKSQLVITFQRVSDENKKSYRFCIQQGFFTYSPMRYLSN